MLEQPGLPSPAELDVPERNWEHQDRRLTAGIL